MNAGSPLSQRSPRRGLVRGSTAFAAALSVLILGACATRVGVDRRPRSTVIESRQIEVGGLTIHYLEKGGEDRVLLVVHGFASYSAPFEPMISALPRSLRVIAPDLPGHGFSDGLSGEYTMARFVRFLNAFVEAKGLDSFSLLGSSMGANIVAHYAVRYPEKVERLILVSPVGLEGQEQRASRLSRRPLLSRIVSAFVGRRTVRRVLFWAAGDDTALVTPDLVDEYALSISTGERRSCMRSVVRNVIAGSYLEGTLPRVTVPVLVIAGEQDPLVRPEHLEEFRNLLRTERVETFASGGHLLHRQFPVEIAGLVAGFLNADSP